MRTTGTTARGIRAPLIKPGDDIAAIAAGSVLDAVKHEHITLNDRDIVGITEAVIARSQGNYATCDQIAADIRDKFPGGTLAAAFPILSRNRFANILKGIARACGTLYLILSYPSDEVGNELVPWDAIDAAGINPYADVFDEKTYREYFRYEHKHIHTGIDYVELYKSYSSHIEVVFANDVRSTLKYSKHVLCCDIHSRARSKRLLRAAGAETVFGLDDILSQPIEGSGYNAQYGLLGSNAATEDTVKLFPRDCDAIVKAVAKRLNEATGKQIEVMVYGDGSFKDPIGKIWELADPVVSPAFTPGLAGKPNEIKMKYLLDNELAGMNDDEKKEAMERALKNKAGDLGKLSLGTTPRMYTDLLGSLCDLISGSGDKGTPIVLVQGYFDNYSDISNGSF